MIRLFALALVPYLRHTVYHPEPATAQHCTITAAQAVCNNSQAVMVAIGGPA